MKATTFFKASSLNIEESIKKAFQPGEFHSTPAKIPMPALPTGIHDAAVAPQLKFRPPKLRP